MTSRLHRRALLQWMAATGVTLPVLVHEALAAEPENTTREIEGFLAVVLTQLFPYDQLDDSVYREAATILTGAVEADPGLQALVVAGRASLDAGSDGPWLELASSAQRAALAASADTAFFKVVRGLGGLVFYSLPEVWQLLGYEGPSFRQGGYLARGFDDIDWLPAAVDAN